MRGRESFERGFAPLRHPVRPIFFLTLLPQRRGGRSFFERDFVPLRLPVRPIFFSFSPEGIIPREASYPVFASL